MIFEPPDDVFSIVNLIKSYPEFKVLKEKDYITKLFNIIKKNYMQTSKASSRERKMGKVVFGAIPFMCWNQMEAAVKRWI